LSVEGSLVEVTPVELAGRVCVPVSSGSSIWTELEPAEGYAFETSSLYEPETAQTHIIRHLHLINILAF